MGVSSKKKPAGKPVQKPGSVVLPRKAEVANAPKKKGRKN
jgi:hypothetical protein